MPNSEKPVAANTASDSGNELSFTGERVIPGKVDADLFNEHFARYVYAREFCRGEEVLDTGCGVGYGSAYLAEVATHVVGIDNDSPAIRFARSHYALVNTAYLVGDCQNLPLQSQAFGVVTSFELIEHLPDAKTYLEEVLRVLKQGGTFVVSTPNRPVYHEHLGDISNPFHVREWDLEEFLAILKARFRFVEPLGEQHLSAVAILGPKSIPLTRAAIEKRAKLESADYFVCVCSDRKQSVTEMVYVPATGNILLERERHIRSLISQLHDRETYLARLQPEFEEKAAWANQLNAELAEAQSKAQGLQAKTQDLQAKAQGLQAKAQDLQAKVQDLQAKVQDLKAKVQDLQAKNEELSALWAKATRWKRAFVFSIFAPLDWSVGGVIIAVESLGRVLRRFSARKAPLPGPQDSTRCSIVVVTWEGKDLLAASLPPLLDAIRFQGGEHEIIVVDNGSTDGTEEYLRDHFPEVRVIRNQHNEYFGGGNNLGVQEAKNDVVVLLNNDMIVHKDFLAPLLDGFRSPEVFAVGSQVFLADSNKPREETGKTRASFNGYDLDWKHDPISPRDEQELYVPVFWGHGGAVALDRQKFRWLGGFDRLYDPFYVEDADLSYQAWKVGWQCLLAIRSKVIHKHRSSTKRFGDQFITQIVRRNHELFIWKNFGDLPNLFKHFLRGYRQRIRRAGIPGIGIRLELRAFLGALKRLPRVISRRLRLARWIVRSDQEIFRLTTPPGLASSSEVDFSRPSSQEQLGHGWHPIEGSGECSQCWMAQEASLWLCAPSATADLQLQGYMPPMSAYGAASISLTVCCGAERTRFDLVGGTFEYRWKVRNLQIGKPTYIHLAVSNTVAPNQGERRTLGVMFKRIALADLNGQLSKTDEEDEKRRAGSVASSACDSVILPDTRKRLLFLCAYVPGVGLHGGGNTMFHLIRKLSDRYRITAVCLMEKEAEQIFVPRLAPFCERLEVMWRRQTLYAHNPLSLRPPEIVYEFYHRRMQEVVDECLKSRSYDVIDCEYLQTAHFVQDYPEIPAVVSHHEVYSLSYRNHYQSVPRFSARRVIGFTNWMRMLNYEEKMFRRFYAVMVVTDTERDYLHHYMPQVRVYAHPTGVDCDFFLPSHEGPERGSVVFLGNFNHAPNVSGILWFLERVWPLVLANCPYARLCVVGGNPPPSLQSWNGREGVQVTGWVEDVRPFLQRSVVFVAPMFEGVGLRGKILEAWASKKPVVGTSLAFLGLNQARDWAGFVADDAESFAARVCDLLANEAIAEQMGTCGRELVVSSFSWDAFANLYHRAYRESMEARYGLNEVMNAQVAGA
jgi:GT2 family glycosyltransferase/glycosyltransferase involved in cell wall biosynthesis/SAM-dependent methyltransferase